ncbi:MAG TPA: SDR family NAD(P)-dependent oxidoreductase [Candidatus Obscuribacter sp.]|nr:SDR family NAD(P)-dependent oxidoreductase [Candidatus Obscuribacter sp.]HMW91428.1 SDR family NAD(P)-dependent oxidoreductase [Candidatus Obscuribacter sp.]HMX45333.1 SDR family NAD(P)-dependent oxidoreductase [Candidatus Obscuribacter sp.]HMY02226.1 SDR family NAD(P)-dependent oxidoreductase [Candidatus Obscuribacter sp.]HNA74062.1 SDR family NAD(P)-dependent oxidoreductase [Candidatus Obscuribacter sp.]
MNLPQGMTAIITGASTGIGRGLALSLTKIYKAKLVLTARSREDLETLAQEVKRLGGEAVVLAADIAGEGVTESLVNLAVKNFGKLNMVVNNAGMGISGSFAKLSEEDWRRIFEVNFFSALTLTQHALPHLRAEEVAKLVNISSVAGKVSIPGSVSYCSTKFALTALSEGLAAELAPDNIDVLTVCPGWVRTEFFQKNDLPNTRNPTEIARRNDLKGFLMKNVLSISTEECVKEIIEALEKGGSRELILTLPGKVAERLQGTAPGVMRFLARQIRPEYK